jgi:Leucine-rich repeat (LRR) protein
LTKFPAVNIINLDLSNNNIERIEKGVFELVENIATLNLSDNSLTSDVLIPDIFTGKYSPESYEPLKKLRVLRLSNNRLHTLNIDLFEHLPNLEELYVDRNPFKLIDHATELAINQILTLRVLDMSNMEINEIPINLYHAPRGLEVLKLDGNLFEKIPDALQYAINLKELSFDENPVVEIDKDNIFPSLPKLKTLSVSHTRTLKYIGHGSLSKLTNLTTLKITNNIALNMISEHALSTDITEDNVREEWPPITTLLLNHNNLSTLDSHLLGRWDNLETVDFSVNPWQCDCDNQWLIDTLMPIVISENNSLLINNVICQTPIEMKDVHVKELTEKGSHLRCLDKYGHHPGRDGIVLVGMLVGLLVGIAITSAFMFLYRNGYLAFMGSRGPADFSRAFYKRTGNSEEYM